MKTLIIFFLLISQIFANKFTLAQCPGDPANSYYFCGSISRNTLNKYLNKAGAFSYVTEPIYTDAQFDEDIIMLQNLQPKWLGRVAGLWIAGGNDAFEFDRAEEIATRIHTDVSEYVILQAAIYENIDPNVKHAGGWVVPIPADVLSQFPTPTYYGYTGYFEHDNMVFPGTNTPDMSKIETQMWFYYRAIRYIDAGYEALHLGQFMLMNNNDPLNQNWWSLLQKIRSYANLHARRGIVFCDAHVNGDGCADDGCAFVDIVPNDVPYLMLSEETPSEQLLFDYISFGLTAEEAYKIPNINNSYDGYDRTITINTSACAMYDNGFGGTMPVDWGWSYGQCHPIPSIAEFDNGGTDPHYDCEGQKTDCSTECQADNDPELDTPTWLTWGFGGESNWFCLQSHGYRNYFETYAYNRVKELDEDIFCRLTLRMPISYSLYPYPGIIYNASNLEYKDEDVIKWLWTNQDEVDFCIPTIETSDFTYGVTGWTGTKHIRTLSDVSGDGKADIVGFGESNVIVAKSNASGTFNTPTIWYNNDFTYAFGWSVTAHVRKLGDFSGDGKMDIIGFGENGVRVAKSNGSGFDAAYNAFNFWGNLDGWDPTKHIRDIGDFNGDGKIDIIGFWDNQTKVRVSDGTHFNNLAPHSDVWSTEFSYNGGWRVDKHLRLIGDVNGDGKDDVVGFKDDNIIVGISTGSDFITSIWYYGNFCYNQGWDNNDEQRYLADVNGDGKADIVGFSYSGVQVALSTGINFSQSDYWIYDFGSGLYAGGWNNSLHIRTVSDINGDGMFDIVGFGNGNTIISLSTGHSFSKIQEYGDFGYPSYTVTNHPRLLADIDNDGRDEIIAFGQNNVYLMNCSSTDATFKEDNYEIDTIFKTDEHSILIFPNPAADKVSFQVPAGANGRIDIVDLSGNIVMSGRVEDNNNYSIINLGSQLPEGLYVVIFYNFDGRIFIDKFIKN